MSLSRHDVLAALRRRVLRERAHRGRLPARRGTCRSPLPRCGQLLLRTCILERVCGPLADALTGTHHGDRGLLGSSQEANAFVVAVDVARDMVSLSPPAARPAAARAAARAPRTEILTSCTARAARWCAAKSTAIPSTRSATPELAPDWDLARELLGRHSVQLVLDGEEATLARLLDGLPEMPRDRTPRSRRSLPSSSCPAASLAPRPTRCSRRPSRRIRAVPAELGAGRRMIASPPCSCFRARQIGDLEDDRRPGGRGPRPLRDGRTRSSAELRALALMNLGIAQTWTLRLRGDAVDHLEQGLALGRADRQPVRRGRRA